MLELQNMILITSGDQYHVLPTLLCMLMKVKQDLQLAITENWRNTGDQQKSGNAYLSHHCDGSYLRITSNVN